jgi:hypothetical protein
MNLLATNLVGGKAPRTKRFSPNLKSGGHQHPTGNYIPIDARAAAQAEVQLLEPEPMFASSWSTNSSRS